MQTNMVPLNFFSIVAPMIKCLAFFGYAKYRPSIYLSAEFMQTGQPSCKCITALHSVHIGFHGLLSMSNNILVDAMVPK